MFKADTELVDGALLVTVEGELDTLSSPDFEKELEPLLEEADSVTIDFAKLEYISSAGLRALLSAEQIMEEKGAEQVRIIHMSDTIRSIFTISGFVDVLLID